MTPFCKSAFSFVQIDKSTPVLYINSCSTKCEKLQFKIIFVAPTLKSFVVFKAAPKMLEILFLHFNGYGSWVKIYADVLEKLRCSQQWQRSLLPSQNQPSGCLSQVSFWAAWSLLNSTTVPIPIILLPTPSIIEAVLLVIHLIQICLCGSIQVNVYLRHFFLLWNFSGTPRSLELQFSAIPPYQMKSSSTLHPCLRVGAVSGVKLLSPWTDIHI